MVAEGNGGNGGGDTGTGEQGGGGCVRVAGNNLNFDPQCGCVQNGTCFQTPKLPVWKKGKTTKGQNFNVPGGLFTSMEPTRDFANALFRGDTRGARLAASRLGQGATRLKGRLADIKKQINRKRKKEGKNPIDFDGEARRLASRIQDSVGRALDNAGIKTVEQFNDAMGRTLGYGDEGSGGGSSQDVRASLSPSEGGDILGSAASSGKGSGNESDDFDFYGGI